MRKTKLSAEPRLTFEVGSDAGRAWELNVYADNTLLEKSIVEGGAGERKWVALSVDLAQSASRDVTLRLYQRVLVANRTAGNALWRNFRLE